MTVQQMRLFVAALYPSQKWKDRVAKMSDNQIIAIYRRRIEVNDR